MQERDFIFTEDVCKKMLDVLNKKNKAVEIEINNNKFLRILDLISIFKKITKNKLHINLYKPLKGMMIKCIKKNFD